MDDNRGLPELKAFSDDTFEGHDVDPEEDTDVHGEISCAGGEFGDGDGGGGGRHCY